MSLWKLLEYARFDPLRGKTSSWVARQLKLPQLPENNQRTVSKEGGEEGKSVVTTSVPFLSPGMVMLKKTTGELWLSWSHCGRDRELVVALVVRPGVTSPTAKGSAELHCALSDGGALSFARK